MIDLSPRFDLGLDRTRIKDPRDALRQAETARAILGRLFAPDPERRFELQVLADEVGMGKTFVALAVAYSVLEHMSDRGRPDDLRGSVGRVVIVTPQNPALFRKWQREVSEFVGRCVLPEHREEARSWFAPAVAERLDELIAALRRNAAGPRVIVTHTGALGSTKLRYYDLKCRFLLGVLFRLWGRRFRVDARQRLLRGAPADWPRDPAWLTELDAREGEHVLFDERELLIGLRRLERREGESGAVSPAESLLELCQEIAAPYARDRGDLFKKVERRLIELYRRAVSLLGRRGIPLVIVDEAHNWKNGPSRGTNNYEGFKEALARRARRVLLMTATPFQLRPEEMLELLRVSDDVKPGLREEAAAERCDRLRGFREEHVRPVLERAAATSRTFSRAWARLPAQFGTDDLAKAWDSTALAGARVHLRELAVADGAIDAAEGGRLIEDAIAPLHPDLRTLLREALQLFVYNADLSAELGRLVIRHRRATDHRLVRVGEEIRIPLRELASRPDRHGLHAAQGLDVRGESELPHYLLMRCVSEMKGGKGRSSLGGDLTGCWSTLLHSAEGKAVRSHFGASGRGNLYLGLLLELVDASRDPQHPKMRAAVETVLEAWRVGEKSLVFCFRTHTAGRLREILDERIRAELEERRERCLGGRTSLDSLRTRLTGRDRDLVTLGLDRVLWSFWWGAHSDDPDLAAWAPCPYRPEDLFFTERDLPELARLVARFGLDVTGERVDRVFLHRAHERVVAGRILQAGSFSSRWRRFLEEIADESWVAGPYGRRPGEETEDRGEEQASFDERGVHSVYEADGEPSAAAIRRINDILAERHARAGERSILDTYARGPSLWLGADPLALTGSGAARGSTRAVDLMHDHLLHLTFPTGEPDWESRRILFQALRRALLRESVLLRLLPESSELEEAQWGELLARTFFAPLRGQGESMADRMEVFLEDIRAASGSLLEPGSPRHTLLEATRLRDQQFVALIKGGGDIATRERVFAGFNSPLLPEVLVCTSVGQEGIDLHRQCRQVIHYDLAWNPAVLEQRTGRVDRIGSKTFRERAAATTPDQVFLEIGVPFLAGTYDERMYAELRLRAQTFEVLTGGEVSVDDVEGRDDVDRPEGSEAGLRFTPLPAGMVADLRVNLHVWKP